MSVEAVIGKPFTFQVLFVNGLNIPIVVNSPTISVFSFSSVGVKEYVANHVPMIPVIPVEVGRYTYTFTVALTFNDGDTLYGDMTGIDPDTLLMLRAEEELTAIAAGRAGAGAYGGLIANFIPGNQLFSQQQPAIVPPIDP